LGFGSEKEYRVQKLKGNQEWSGVDAGQWIAGVTGLKVKMKNEC
jgi:hypothetical protein